MSYLRALIALAVGDLERMGRGLPDTRYSLEKMHQATTLSPWPVHREISKPPKEHSSNAC